jgi:hypothetical protein
MIDEEPIRLFPLAATAPAAHAPPAEVSFDRRELNAILTVYGRMVAAGEWRDYAIDFLREKAVFSVFRRASEAPLYRIEKIPKLARKQGAYAVVTTTGLILKRGHDLGRVLAALDKGNLRVVSG